MQKGRLSTTKERLPLKHFTTNTDQCGSEILAEAENHEVKVKHKVSVFVASFFRHKQWNTHSFELVLRK